MLLPEMHLLPTFNLTKCGWSQCSWALLEKDTERLIIKVLELTVNKFEGDVKYNFWFHFLQVQGGKDQ